MIYYYFGSKEGLFIAVIEEVYRRFNEAEAALVLDDGQRPLRQALADVIRFIWGYYQKNPEFITLLNTENLHRGKHIGKSLRAREYSSPVLQLTGRAAGKPAPQQGVFRRRHQRARRVPDDRGDGLLLPVEPLHAVGLPGRAAGNAGGAGALGILPDRRGAAHRGPSLQRAGRDADITWRQAHGRHRYRRHFRQGGDPQHRLAALGRHRPADPRRRHRSWWSTASSPRWAARRTATPPTPRR